MLSATERASLRRDGYLRLPGHVPAERVRAALKAVNASLGRGIDPADLTTLRNQSFCPELREADVVSQLYTETPLAALTSALLGEGQVFRHPKAQIALRFPEARADAPAPVPHVDGFYTAANGVAAGTVGTFTGIFAVFLSDVPEENAGNFTVWPGSHAQLAEYYREHAPDPGLPNGIPPVPLPPPVQLLARAGDVVLANYLLAHTAAGNASPWVRYAVFFRFQRQDHADRRRRDLAGLLRDPWGEWQGL